MARQQARLTLNPERELEETERTIELIPVLEFAHIHEEPL